VSLKVPLAAHLDPIARKLAELFQTHLPITHDIDMNIEHYDGQTLTFKAPLAPILTTSKPLSATASTT